MTTGGEAKELDRMKRSDRWALRDAVVAAARAARDRGEQVRPDHVRDALCGLARDGEPWSEVDVIE